jgi:hypothetical protein
LTRFRVAHENLTRSLFKIATSLGQTNGSFQLWVKLTPSFAMRSDILVTYIFFHDEGGRRRPRVKKNAMERTKRTCLVRFLARRTAGKKRYYYTSSISFLSSVSISHWSLRTCRCRCSAASIGSALELAAVLRPTLKLKQVSCIKSLVTYS